MKLVISRKHTASNSNQKLDLTELGACLRRPGAPVAIAEFQANETAKMEAHIQRLTEDNHACHVFDYADTYITQNTLVAAKAK
jgi:hypothetical protein